MGTDHHVVRGDDVHGHGLCRIRVLDQANGGDAHEVLGLDHARLVEGLVQPRRDIRPTERLVNFLELCVSAPDVDPQQLVAAGHRHARLDVHLAIGILRRRTGDR